MQIDGKPHWKTPGYETWRSIKQRCYNKNNPAYKYYGGRGITVEKRWLNSFLNFLEDMGPKPQGKSLERENNSKGYTSSNCVWATAKDQSRNRRDVKKHRYNGVNLTLAEWGEKLGVAPSTLWSRIYVLGWNKKETFTNKKYHFNRWKNAKVLNGH